jgi:hypothetical protein
MFDDAFPVVQREQRFHLGSWNYHCTWRLLFEQTHMTQNYLKRFIAMTRSHSLLIRRADRSIPVYLRDQCADQTFSAWKTSKFKCAGEPISGSFYCDFILKCSKFRRRCLSSKAPFTVNPTSPAPSILRPQKFKRHLPKGAIKSKS